MTKVLDMLADLDAKVVDAAKSEDMAHENYTKFCVKSKRDVGYEIKDGESAVEEVSATIEKATSDAEGASKRMMELQTSIAKDEADLKAALEIRSAERAEREKGESELKDSVDMLSKAIKTLNEKLGGSALLQQVPNQDHGLLEALGAIVDAASFPHSEKESLLAFVENQAPAVPAYTSKSGGIVSTLEDMKVQAKEQLTTLLSEEVTAQHSFELLQQSLKDQIEAAKKELQQVTSVKAEAEVEAATAKKDLDVSSKDLANDKVSLADLESSCAQAEADYETSTKAHAAEREALAKATAALKEKTGNAEASVYSPAALLQVKSHVHLATPEDLHGFEVVQIVRNLAKKSASPSLTQLATNIESMVQTDGQAAGDVFAKVKQLITDMITSRKETAAAEETKKAYCEEEKSKTNEKVSELTSAKDMLSAKKDKKQSQATTMKSEAEKLHKDLAEMAETKADMDASRIEERAAFAKTKKDMTEGMEGVRMALSVLRDFYQNTESTMGASQSTGIIGMLEVVETDFGRNLAEAETAETSKEENYQKLTDQDKVTKIQKEADLKYKETTSAALLQATQEVISDEEASQEQLDAVLKYQQTLQQECLEGAMSYEERVAKREEEIEGLKSALSALSDTPALLQANSKGLRGSLARKHQ
mmetsp:Transcript_32318/g.58656  ORF Transcript_32318/g.58656 Transcript_32318/m.58656 type:complete len:651 (-) Transcript_32318:85-2037(-)